MSEAKSEWQDLEADISKTVDDAESLGWTLAHEVEGLVRYVKRIPYQDAPLEAFGPDKATAPENVKAQEAALSPSPAPVTTDEEPEETEPEVFWDLIIGSFSVVSEKEHRKASPVKHLHKGPLGFSQENE